MSTIRPMGASPLAAPDAAGSADEQRLRKAASQLEGVFVEQLFKAMRETVPQDGLTSGGAGEEIFSGLMDQHLAEAVPGQWQDELGEALYRQLRTQLPRTS
jgi:flagellar protein FlgJ